MKMFRKWICRTINALIGLSESRKSNGFSTRINKLLARDQPCRWVQTILRKYYRWLVELYCLYVVTDRFQEVSNSTESSFTFTLEKFKAVNFLDNFGITLTAKEGTNIAEQVSKLLLKPIRRAPLSLRFACSLVSLNAERTYEMRDISRHSIIRILYPAIQFCTRTLKNCYFQFRIQRNDIEGMLIRHANCLMSFDGINTKKVTNVKITLYYSPLKYWKKSILTYKNIRKYHILNIVICCFLFPVW